MNDYVYISLAQEDRIVSLELEQASGKAIPRGSFEIEGGPSAMVVAPSLELIYVGLRSKPGIAALGLERTTGNLALQSAIALDDDPCYLSIDRTGRFLFSSYYGAGKVGVHPIGEGGALLTTAAQWHKTALNAHSIQSDPSNRFAFVPHTGPNRIFQFLFDETNGHLNPNSPDRLAPAESDGPRHFCFHPNGRHVCFVNEQGSSITVYELNQRTGALAPVQTVSTLPSDFTGENSCSQIHITPDGRYLYASNRGHDSIACYTVDADSGRLALIELASTEKTPRAFNLDTKGRYLLATGLDTGKLATYKISPDTGSLVPLEVQSLGRRPMWVLVIPR